jgi:recombination endonuclease VII
MLAEQDDACAMCFEPFSDDEMIYIDHDHHCCPDERSSCGRCVRGLLNRRCNVAVGYIERYGDLARAYLEKTATPQPRRPEGRRLKAI